MGEAETVVVLPNMDHVARMTEVQTSVNWSRWPASARLIVCRGSETLSGAEGVAEDTDYREERVEAEQAESAAAAKTGFASRRPRSSHIASPRGCAGRGHRRLRRRVRGRRSRLLVRPPHPTTQTSSASPRRGEAGWERRVEDGARRASNDADVSIVASRRPRSGHSACYGNADVSPRVSIFGECGGAPHRDSPRSAVPPMRRSACLCR